MLLASRRPTARVTGWDLAVDVLVLASLDSEYNDRVNQVRRYLPRSARAPFLTFRSGLERWDDEGTRGSLARYAAGYPHIVYQGQGAS